MPAANLERRFCILREVHVVPRHFLQAVLTNRIEKARRCAVIKQLGRGVRFVSQINVERMPLTGADLLGIFAERKPLLIARCYDIFQLFSCKGHAVLIDCLEQFVNRNPTCGVEGDANPLWLVPQNQAQEFAHSNDFFV